MFSFKKNGALKNWLFFATLLVLTLPHVSHEFSFGFGGDKSEADTRSGVKKDVIKRRPAEKKFKFRKIERIYVDESTEDNEEEEEDDDQEEPRYQRNSVSRATADSEQIDNELEFEKAKKVRKERKKDEKKKEDNPNDDSDEESQSLLSTLTFGLLGDADNDGGSEENVTPSNGIIDWIKWLVEKSDGSNETPDSMATSNEDWTVYFNRWPFNTLFPIGKRQKPIPMPRSAAAKMQKGNRRGEDEKATRSEPMSQRHFESLLHTLPGFILNASRVPDIDCKQQLQIFQRQLRGNKLWPLQMLDANGKISSGLLRGHINQFGDFDLCTQIKTIVKVTADTPIRIRGKYCLAHIETDTDVPDLKVPIHLAHGRGLWNSHLGNPNHFLPRYTVANWGLCVPQLCAADVVQRMMETYLRPYNDTGVEFHVEVDENDCYTHTSKSAFKLIKNDGKSLSTFLLYLLLVLLMIGTIAHEHWETLKNYSRIAIERVRRKPSTSGAIDEKEEEQAKEESVDGQESGEAHESKPENDEDQEKQQEKNQEDKTDNQPGYLRQMIQKLKIMMNDSLEVKSMKILLKEIAMSFSPKRTFQVLTAHTESDIELFPIFHVLKLGATLMLYICLKYIMFGHLPITNRDNLARAMDNTISVAYRLPLIYTDILLLISGFLSAYQLSEEMEQKLHINILKRFVAKISRYLPTLYVVLCFQTWILPHLGAGPLWTNVIGKNAEICEQQMWRNIFSVQNSIDIEETCSPMTIQLAIEMQLYLLAPLLVWLYYSNSEIGFYTYGGIQALSVAVRYARTNSEHLSMTLFYGMNVSKFYRTANLLFASPISRATPYLLGIGAGILYRTQDGILDVAPELVPYGWGLCLISIIWCFWSESSGMHADFVYSSSDAAKYATWCPLIMGLALVWIIFMFPKNENSIVKHFISSRPVLILSRIAFPMQLSMFVVVLYNTAIVKEPLKYHLTDLVNLSEIGIIIMFGVVLAFLIDVPSRHIRTMIIERIFIERPESEHEPVSCGEQSEGEFSEDLSEKIDVPTSPTPEPTEAIWASDPEEEERKYIERRRSSTIAPAETGDTTNNEVEQDATETEEPTAATVVDKKSEEPEPSSYRRRRRPVNDD